MERRSRRKWAIGLAGFAGLTLLALPVFRWPTPGTRYVGPSIGGGLGPGSPDPLVQSVRAATTILRGTVGAASGGHRKTVTIRGKGFPVDENEAEFALERVIKGTQASGMEKVLFFATAEYPGFAGVRPGQHGLVFLNDQGEVVDPLRPILLLGPGGVQGQPSPDSLQAVKQEMIFSLRDDVPSAILWDLAYELVVWLRVGVEEVRPALSQLAASSDDNVSAVGLWGLAKYQDPAAVATLVKVAIAHASDPQHPSRRAIAAVGGPGFQDPALAPLIDPLLDTNVYEWRRDALLALREMRSIAHIYRFAAALDDKDPYIQYYGVTGLAWTLRAHGQDLTPGWGGTVQDFRGNAHRYLSFWKNWWETEGRAEYGKQ